MVRFENGLKIRPMRPRPRGVKRFSTSALPTWACETIRSSTSSSWLFSAFAIADSRHFFTSRAMRLLENCKSASAVATFLPRMSCATRFSFCGDTRSMRATALASLSESVRSRLRLPMTVPLFSLLVSALGRRRGGGRRSCGGSRCCRRARCLAIRRVAVELAGRREFAELVTHHFLGHHHRDVLLAVVDAKCESHELRQDGRAPAPDLDHFSPP